MEAVCPYQVRSVDALVALCDDGSHSLEEGSLGSPVAAGARTVILAGQDNEGPPLIPDQKVAFSNMYTCKQQASNTNETTQPPTAVCKMEAQLEYTHIAYIRTRLCTFRADLYAQLITKNLHWSSVESVQYYKSALVAGWVLTVTDLTCTSPPHRTRPWPPQSRGEPSLGPPSPRTCSPA